MEEPLHPLHALFEQLGLPGDHVAIEAFIARHAPLADEVRLSEASFWAPQQALFLCESVRDDADWASVVDRLDALLRQRA